MRKFALAIVTCSAALGLAACDVDQTEEAELPDVDVSAEGGNLPEFDVEAADVELGTEETTVEVPTLDIEDNDAQGEPVTGSE